MRVLYTKRESRQDIRRRGRGHERFHSPRALRCGASHQPPRSALTALGRRQNVALPTSSDRSAKPATALLQDWPHGAGQRRRFAGACGAPALTVSWRRRTTIRARGPRRCSWRAAASASFAAANRSPIWSAANSACPGDSRCRVQRARPSLPLAPLQFVAQHAEISLLLRTHQPQPFRRRGQSHHVVRAQLHSHLAVERQIDGRFSARESDLDLARCPESPAAGSSACAGRSA